jgi:type VI secretion system protein ImpA
LDLLSRTHDLRVAMILLRALLHNKGIPGLSDGLGLIAGFIERYWDSVYPHLDLDDDYDPEYRINILMTLGDRETIISPLMNATLFSSASLGCFNLRHIHIAQGKIEVPENDKKAIHDLATIEAVLMDSDSDSILSTLSAVRSSLKNIDRLESLLAEKVKAEVSPSFREIREILSNILHFMQQRNRENTAPKSKLREFFTRSSEARRTANNPAGSLSMTDQVNSRQDVTRILEAVCAYYRKNEPASPVPLLLKRAMRLVDKDFMEIIKDLTPGSMDQIMLISGTEEIEP